MQEGKEAVSSLLSSAQKDSFWWKSRSLWCPDAPRRQTTTSSVHTILGTITHSLEKLTPIRCPFNILLLQMVISTSCIIFPLPLPTLQSSVISVAWYQCSLVKGHPWQQNGLIPKQLVEKGRKCRVLTVGEETATWKQMQFRDPERELLAQRCRNGTLWLIFWLLFWSLFLYFFLLLFW